MKLRMITLLLIISVLGYAQKNEEKRVFMDQLNVAINASTMGFGVEVATPINNYFNLRAGYGTFSLSENLAIGISDEEIYKLLSYDPSYEATINASFNHGRVLVDFTPVKRGFFHITTGFFVGETKIKSNGFLVNPKTGFPAVNDLPNGSSWPELSFDKYYLEIGERGDIPVSIKFGNTIKPYFGLGLGRAVTNKRIGFKFELGILYQGEYKLYQNNRKISLDFSGENDNTLNNVQSVTKLLEWWPMLNFQLSYRVF